jgi:hypothetical protein
MRSFVLGIAVGAIVTIAIVELRPSRHAQVAGESRPTSAASATLESICGRNTFYIHVDVARFQALTEGEETAAGEINKRLDRLAVELRDRLERAGLRHEMACPVILNVFGSLMQKSPVRWTVSTKVELDKVELHKTERSAMDYPTWNSGWYNGWWHTRGEAQDDLERSLFERVQRFLMYFGKPGDGPAAFLEPRTGKP